MMQLWKCILDGSRMPRKRPRGIRIVIGYAILAIRIPHSIFHCAVTTHSLLSPCAPISIMCFFARAIHHVAFPGAHFSGPPLPSVVRLLAVAISHLITAQRLSTAMHDVAGYYMRITTPLQSCRPTYSVASGLIAVGACLDVTAVNQSDCKERGPHCPHPHALFSPHSVSTAVTLQIWACSVVRGAFSIVNVARHPHICTKHPCPDHSRCLFPQPGAVAAHPFVPRECNIFVWPRLSQLPRPPGEIAS